MPEYIYAVRNLTRKYGTKEVLRGITLAFYYGAKIGVIGHNGSGKSTLLRVMAGEDRDYEGEARLLEGATVGYVPQEPALDPARTVMGNIEEAVAPVRALLERYETLSERLGEALDDDEMAKVVEQHERAQREIEARDAWELDHHLELAMHALRCPPPDADVTKISGGERRRVALCRALLAHPDLLLLDEPTNHLDAETTSWLEHHLAEYPGTVILVTHDRYFLDHVAKWMLEMDRGRGTPYEGNYSAYLEQKQQRLLIEEKAEAARQKVLARELEWIRQSPRARIAKNKARIANYERLAAQQAEEREDAIELTIPAGARLGARVVEFKNVHKALGGKPLIRDLSFTLPPGAVLGVIGPNGAGKTTLLKLVTGALKPDSGSVEVGATVELCYVDQGRETLDAGSTVFQEITGGQDQLALGKRLVNSRAYVSWFNFKGTDQQQKVGDLSGGQRNRVQLAKLLRRGGNVLLLDEPTNDLDLQTLRVLEEALQNFAGCAVVVTHDRYFLNRISTHVLAFDGDGGVRFFEGDFSTFEERLAKERADQGLGPESAAGKYRKFSR